MPPARRKTWEPPADLETRAVPSLRLEARAWFRVHWRGEPAATFRLAAHHRYSHPGCTHPILYLGSDPSTCLWERFGDGLFGGAHTLSFRFLGDFVLTRIEVPALLVCDLTATRVRNALSVDRATLMHPDLEVTQAWGRAIQRHANAFRGMRYTSRFIDRPCLAVFDREALAGELVAATEGSVLELPSTTEWLERNKVRLV